MAPKRELFVAAGDGAAPPQGKRMRAESAPGSGSTSTIPEPPSSPKHFLAIVLVVLFLKRPKGRTQDTSSASASQFGRPVLDRICRLINTMYRKLEKVESKLERIEERIEDLTVKVDNRKRPSPNCHNREAFTQEANQEGTSAEAEGLATAETEITSIRLRFLNRMKTHVYHDNVIKSESNTAIKIGIFDGDKMIETGRLSNVQVEIFALEGDFPHASPKSWTAKKLNKHRANARDGSGNVLAGEGTKAQLKNGQCDLGSIKFREGSCKARGGKFIIGARVCEGEVYGVQVQGAVMNPVVVQDRRNKFNEKRYPPKLKDRVYRLEEIAKDGKYCKRLEEQNIFTVEDFLKALNKDPDNLADVLQIKKEHGNWKKMVEHARKCCLKAELKSYRCMEGNVVLFFDCVHGLVGAEFHGRYTACDKFNEHQQNLVDELKGSAYDRLDALRADYMDVGSGSVRVVPSGERVSHARFESCIADTNSDPGPSSSIPNHHKPHQYQVQGTQLTCQEQDPFACLNDWCQESVGRLNSRNQTTEELYHGDEDGEVWRFFQAEAPVLNQVEILSQLLCPDSEALEASTSSRGYIRLTPQQPRISGAPASAEGSMQSQMQDSLPPTIGALVASSSAQAYPHPPQELPHRNGWF